MSDTHTNEIAEIVEELGRMLEAAKALQARQAPQLAGDIERVVAILADKVRHLDPERFEHVTEYE